MTDQSDATQTTRPLALDDAFFADPENLYRVLRRRCRVAKVATRSGVDVWMSTRYDDARAAPAESRLLKSATRFAQVLRTNGAAPNARILRPRHRTG